MHLLDRLRRLAGKLGLVEVAETATSAPQKIQTHAVNLEALAAQVREEEVRALAQRTDATAGFEEIFAAAGIKPPAHGWTIERLRADERFRKLTGEMLQRAVLAHLMNAGIDGADLVRDAVARDEALDAYEAGAIEKLNQRRLIREQKLAELQQEMASDEAQWKEWKAGKVAYEKELARWVACFVDTKVISTE